MERVWNGVWKETHSTIFFGHGTKGSGWRTHDYLPEGLEQGIKLRGPPLCSRPTTKINSHMLIGRRPAILSQQRANNC